LNNYFLILFIISTFYSCEFLDKPENIIVMISDGCGYNHIDATSLYEFGETGKLAFEQFPVQYGMSTYSLKANSYSSDSAWTSFNYLKCKPTESAAAATAMATGIKTHNGKIGVDSANVNLENLTERLEAFGKSTGIVTSVQLSHATPAGFVAHNESRKNYEEIANEMIFKSKIDVIMGCGHPWYNNNGKATKDSNYKYVGGDSTWNLLLNGKAGNDADNDGIIDYWTVIQDRSEFQNLAYGQTPKRVFGIPKVAKTLQKNRAGDGFADPFKVPILKTMPTLTEMVNAAINILDDDPDGFFLMIEGGAIDWASHANQSGRMIEEELAFNEVVKAIILWVEQKSNWSKTLLIVTGDHETGYLTGPDSAAGKTDMTGNSPKIGIPLKNYGKNKMPGLQWNSGSHTNSLIPFFAKGVGSQKFENFASQIDSVRGHYLDNTSIAKLLFSFYE